jgi:hypothetical protein
MMCDEIWDRREEEEEETEDRAEVFVEAIETLLLEEEEGAMLSCGDDWRRAP